MKSSQFLILFFTVPLLVLSCHNTPQKKDESKVCKVKVKIDTAALSDSLVVTPEPVNTPESDQPHTLTQ